MDKYEYKIRAEEIKSLIEKGEYIPAAEIADTIDWRRVKSVMMLCTISDLYKINRRYEDARDMLLLAYDRHPGGRAIVYSLCELSIKMGDFVQAVEYYKEFVQVAPRDTSRFILQYKLYEAQEVGLEERIAVLEEMVKNHDYREKWMYELAYLYHRLGLPTQCVEICDELILYFSKESGAEPEESKYVIKAMELKMLHQALSPEQQRRYDARFGIQIQEPYYEQMPQETVQSAEQPTVQEAPIEEMDIKVKTADLGQYNTINLQKELAEGLKEILNEKEAMIQDPITRSIIAPMMESDTEALDLPQIEEVDEDALESEEMQETEVFFGETGEIGSWEEQEKNADNEPHLVKRDTAEIVMEQLRMENTAPIPPIPVQEEVEQEEQSLAESEEVVVEESFAAENVQEQEEEAWAEEVSAEQEEEPEIIEPETVSRTEEILVDTEALEKQITGQLSIEDVLAEWERLKKENEEKNKEQVRQKVLSHTGPMFTEFETALRDGLLEQLEERKNAEQAVVAANAANAFITEEPEELGTVEELEEIREWEDVEDPETYDIHEEVTEAEVTTEAEELVEEETSVEMEEFVEEEEFAEAEEAVDMEESIEAQEAVNMEESIEAQEAVNMEESIEAQEAVNMEESIEAEESAETEEVIEEQESAETPEGMETEQASEEGNEEAATAEIIQNSENDVPAEAEEAIQEEQPAAEPAQREKVRVRNLTKEERELFGAFIQNKSSREQLVKAIDSISMAAYTGNVIITGEEGMDTLNLAKNMVREVQMTDSNFSGKTAKISGASFNSKDPAKILEQLKNGALIIQKASEMNTKTVESLYKGLQQESLGIIVVLEDTRKAMERLLEEHSQLKNCFNARMDMEALSNESLVVFGRKYAREREYTIDEMGVLALHTRIEDMQTSTHVVTVMEVKEIVDEAIRRANRKNFGHFVDILLAKRYDDEDMIILREKDFV